MGEIHYSGIRKQKQRTVWQKPNWVQIDERYLDFQRPYSGYTLPYAIKQYSKSLRSVTKHFPDLSRTPSAFEQPFFKKKEKNES